MASPEWFGAANLFSFGGSSLAVTVFVNTIRKLTKKNWDNLTTQRVVFAICLLITSAAVLKQNPKSLLDWFLIMPLNACLLFCAALGINVLGGAAVPRKDGFAKEAGFFEPWIGRVK